MPGYHGLPQKPQFSAQLQAGPSRPPAQHSRRVNQPHIPQAQPFPQYQTPAYPYAYPYAQTSGGYQPYQAYYQPQYAYQQQQGYPVQPIATPEGYTYSTTYAAQPVVADTRDPKRARTGPAPIPSAGTSDGFKPWRNCSHPGCKYVGSGEDVEIHEGDRHLIFPNGKPVERSEEEEKWARHKGPPPPIEGTGIVLSSDEDIAKWIAERKAKWPSAKRLAEREEERQAAIARGENPDRGRGRGRGGSRGGRRADPASQAEDWGRPVREETQSGRGASRGRGQDRGRGPGRGRGLERHIATDSSAKGATPPATGGPVEPVPEAASVPSARPSIAGLADYASEDEAKASEAGSTDADSDSSSDSSSGDDEFDKIPAKPVTAPAKPEKPVCRFFAKKGRCKMGNKCRFSHQVEPKASHPTLATPKPPTQKQPPLKKINPFERPSMLGALLATPIQNTLSQLTQTIRFLVANDMLKGVELKPGDAELQVREKTKVVEVATRSDASPTAGLVQEL